MSMLDSLLGRGAGPAIQRVRHELRRRTLDVAAVERLTPHMIRVTLTGAELAGFVSASPDDHIKVFVPGLDGEVTRRDYTPRRHDPDAGTLVLDFVSHDGGPAVAWARAARVGDRLEIAGPRGSRVVTGPVDRWLLIGDETALPAIGRRVEELSARDRVTSVVAVAGADDEQVFATTARHEAYWVHRPMEEADQARGILDVLAAIDIPDRTFVWVGAEAAVAKAVRRYLLDNRGIAAQWIMASGYWVMGTADADVQHVGEDA
ncbi:siderophore-interacting protein [Gluconacetobacter sacchari]|uniref:siderophore-interacting protein n=1 Tax=Gluconacetobacter sacchari TaxID=92759 RepID=UPI0039B47DC8